MNGFLKAAVFVLLVLPSSITGADPTTEPGEAKQFPDIIIVSMEGHKLARINNKSLRISRPSWTYDGKALVYAAKTTIASYLYVHDISASEPAKCLFSSGSDFDPDCSPVAGEVLFSSMDESGTLHLFVASLSGQTKRPLDLPAEIGSCFAARWSPSADMIAFCARKDFDAPQHVYVMNNDCTDLRRITSGSEAYAFPCWSPDGKALYCAKEERTPRIVQSVVTIDIDSGQEKVLLSDLRLGPFPSIVAATPKDGNIIVPFAADGSDLTSMRLATFVNGEGPLALMNAKDEEGSAAPVISPDGKKIAFLSDYASPATGFKYAFQVYNARFVYDDNKSTAQILHGAHGELIVLNATSTPAELSKMGEEFANVFVRGGSLEFCRIKGDAVDYWGYVDSRGIIRWHPNHAATVPLPKKWRSSATDSLRAGHMDLILPEDGGDETDSSEISGAWLILTAAGHLLVPEPNINIPPQRVSVEIDGGSMILRHVAGSDTKLLMTIEPDGKVVVDPAAVAELTIQGQLDNLRWQHFDTGGRPCLPDVGTLIDLDAPAQR